MSANQDNTGQTPNVHDSQSEPAEQFEQFTIGGKTFKRLYKNDLLLNFCETYDMCAKLRLIGDRKYNHHHLSKNYADTYEVNSPKWRIVISITHGRGGLSWVHAVFTNFEPHFTFTLDEPANANT